MLRKKGLSIGYQSEPSKTILLHVDLVRYQ